MKPTKLKKTKEEKLLSWLENHAIVDGPHAGLMYLQPKRVLNYVTRLYGKSKGK